LDGGSAFLQITLDIFVVFLGLDVIHGAMSTEFTRIRFG
jgi:hypothetical protein